MIALFNRFPTLENRLPHTELGVWPTPVDCISGTAIGVDYVYVKRDDITGSAYGGNKVRKLEFLLAEAKRRSAREVMTFGFAGSNHATATAVYANQLGLRGISMLMPQAISHGLRRNLLLSHASGALLKHYGGVRRVAAGALLTSAMRRIKIGVFPMIIPAGGSSPLGICGFVNAALELKKQIDDGTLPAPPVIYVAVGSMGTVAGLAIGLQAAGLNTRIAAIRVIHATMASEDRLKKLFAQTVAYLRRLDTSFPDVRWIPGQVEWRNEFFGSDYAVYTAEGVEAADWFWKQTGLALDGTYSAKGLAALVHDARSGRLAGQTPLFWNTFNSRPAFDAVNELDYKQLPPAFHRYFEEDVQPLDR
ncbi:MAG: 1-aminocyclopropane-1-carboxylate deaminase [Candidatus Hydrogenedentota bacterium]